MPLLNHKRFSRKKAKNNVTFICENDNVIMIYRSEKMYEKLL